MGRRHEKSLLQPEFVWEWDHPLYTEEPPYFPHPGNDNERLMNFQHDWIVKQDQKAWSGLWALVTDIAGKMARLRMREKGKRLDSEAVHDIAYDAAMYLLNRYQYYRQEYGKEYVIRKSYTSAIFNAVQHACDYANKGEKLVDFVDITFFATWSDTREDLG